MKKRRVLWALMSVLIICSTVLMACMPVATPAPAPAAQEVAKKTRVALVLDGKIDDNGWNQAAYEGLTKAQQQYNLDIAYSEGVPIPDYEKAMRDYANQGFDIIIAHSSIAKDAVMNTARDFPKLAFVWTDGDTTQPNVAVIRPMAQEASYLAGILAGKMTKSNIIGMVGGIDIPSTHRSSAAFKLGVESVNPKAKVLMNWIGSFLDVSAGKEAALSQIESGADVIFGNGDGQNIGVLKAASEKNVPAIGAVRDQFAVAPNVVLTSVNWGFDSAISEVIKDIIDGNFSGKTYDIGLAHGADLMPYHDSASKIPDDVKALIEQKRKEILDGTLKVPNVPMGQ